NTSIHIYVNTALYFRSISEVKALANFMASTINAYVIATRPNTDLARQNFGYYFDQKVYNPSQIFRFPLCHKVIGVSGEEQYPFTFQSILNVINALKSAACNMKRIPKAYISIL